MPEELCVGLPKAVMERRSLKSMDFTSCFVIFLFKYALVIARFRVQYGQYFPRFSYFADLFHEPLGE